MRNLKHKSVCYSSKIFVLRIEFPSPILKEFLVLPPNKVFRFCSIDMQLIFYLCRSLSFCLWKKGTMQPNRFSKSRLIIIASDFFKTPLDLRVVSSLKFWMKRLLIRVKTGEQIAFRLAISANAYGCVRQNSYSFTYHPKFVTLGSIYMDYLWFPG